MGKIKASQLNADTVSVYRAEQIQFCEKRKKNGGLSKERELFGPVHGDENTGGGVHENKSSNYWEQSVAELMNAYSSMIQMLIFKSN